MRKINVGMLIICLLIPLITGGISAALSSRGMAAYASMNKPPLSPPAWLFPVAWTILYLMMGFSSYLIIMSDVTPTQKTMALILYAIQLVMNFMWSIVFFNWEMYLLAFVWLIVLWLVVIFCAFRFFAISKLSAYLMIPYIIWLTFAAYLNTGAHLLNPKI